ncbi:MAG: TonB-dependent receptor [Parvularculaceae bacterium]
MKSVLMTGAAALSLSIYASDVVWAHEASRSGSAAAIDEILVIGRGETRQTQSIVVEDTFRLPPGASPIRLIERLPGVAVSGGDAFGAYEWAVRINIRGFAQQQLGFTLDGVPLGDMSYGNHNGLHISRAIIGEDLGRAELAQGSGALDVAASNNLGGALKFFSRDPSESFGIRLAGTYGADNAWRGYASVDTGEWGQLGTRLYGSYAYGTTDKWKGEGEQNLEAFAFKFVQPIGAAQLSAYYSQSDRREQDYQDLSLEMISRLGYDWDNFGRSNYALAVNVADIAHNRGDTGVAPTNPAAGTTYPAPIASVDDAYFDASGLRKDKLGYAKFELPLGEIAKVAVQGYFHDNGGQGLWGTPYRASPNAYTPGATVADAPLSLRTTEYDIFRNGVVASLGLTLGGHEISGGVWIEENDFKLARRFYALDRAAPNRNFHEFQTDPFFTQFAYTFDTETFVFYVQDVWQITDRLKLSAGFKNLDVKNEIRTTAINNAPPVIGADSNVRGVIETDKNFLPQAGVNYALSDATEIFASYSKNAAAFVSSPFGATPFSARSQAAFDFVRDNIEPETSQTFEAGLRTTGPRYQLGIAAYYVKFDDRLLAVAQGPGIVGNAALLSNVGGVRTFGAEFIGAYQFTDAISVIGTYSYNNSEYTDDVVNASGAVVAATDGATVVNTPKHIMNVDAVYDDGTLFGSIGANYLSDRYFTYTNNGGRVDGRLIVDASLGYRLNTGGVFDGLEAQVNVTNLFDKNYVGTLGTNGFVNAGDAQTLIAGAPRQWFITLRKSF